MLPLDLLDLKPQCPHSITFKARNQRTRERELRMLSVLYWRLSFPRFLHRHSTDYSIGAAPSLNRCRTEAGMRKPAVWTPGKVARLREKMSPSRPSAGQLTRSPYSPNTKTGYKKWVH